MISGTAKLKCSLVASVESIILDAVEMHFGTVRVNGKESRFTATTTKLEVFLGKSGISVGNTFDVEIEYSAIPRKGLFFMGPTEVDSTGIRQVFVHCWPNDSRYWYPCFDHPSMRSSTETIVTLPKSMTAVSNGKLLSIKDSRNETRTWHFLQEFPHPAYIRSIVAGDLTEFDDSWRNVPLEYFVLSDRSKDEALRTFGETPEIMEYFSKVIGTNYPYVKYAQTAVGFMGGGTETISATIVSDELLHDARAHEDYTNSGDVVAHELAHQWFGDCVTCKHWSHAWLNEGFATYFTALYREFAFGEDDFRYFMEVPYRESYLQERYMRPIVTSRFWDAEEVFDRHAYEKGAWVLHLLRGTFGDQVFFNSIARYVKEHMNSGVETADLRKSFEFVSGEDLTSFFNEWLYCPGIPEYEVIYSWNALGKEINLSIEQKNAGKDNVPLFTNPITIKITGEKNKSGIKKTIRMTKSKENFVFHSLGEEPLNVSFDPDDWILKSIDLHKPLRMFLYQLENSDSVMERVWALHYLSNLTKSEDRQIVVSALEKAVETDRFWGVRYEASKELGNLKSQGALNFLLSKTRADDSKVRRGVAFALRNFSDVEDLGQKKVIVDELVWLLNNDESYFVRANAVWSLGFYSPEQGVFEAMESALKQDSVVDIVRSHTFKGFSERPDLRAIPLALNYLRSGKEMRGRVAAVSYLGKTLKDDPKIMDSILELKDAWDPRLRSEAVSALENSNDHNIVPILQQWLENEIYGNVRRKLRELIVKLQKNESK